MRGRPSAPRKTVRGLGGGRASEGRRCVIPPASLRRLANLESVSHPSWPPIGSRAPGKLSFTSRTGRSVCHHGPHILHMDHAVWRAQVLAARCAHKGRRLWADLRPPPARPPLASCTSAADHGRKAQEAGADRRLCGVPGQNLWQCGAWACVPGRGRGRRNVVRPPLPFPPVCGGSHTWCFACCRCSATPPRRSIAR